jgi:hypothetical protein
MLSEYKFQRDNCKINATTVRAGACIVGVDEEEREIKALERLKKNRYIDEGIAEQTGEAFEHVFKDFNPRLIKILRETIRQRTGTK